MKSSFLKRLICMGLISGSLLIGNVTEAGVVTDRVPLQCYADHQVNTYNSPGAAQRSGYISANVDKIQILEVRPDGWCRGTYPVKNGSKTRWFKITDVFADAGYTNRTANVKGKQAVYRTRGGSATIGSVSNNEGVIVVADNGSRAQIIYRLDNGTGYKMGWVPSSAVSVPGPIIKMGDVNGDGKVDATDVSMARDILLGDASYNRAADINGDGAITAQDLSSIKELAEQNNPVYPDVAGRLANLATNTNGYKIGTKYTGSGQCRGFANKVYLATFQGVQYISGYTNSNYGAGSFAGSHEIGRLFNFGTGAVGEVKALFSKAKPGDFVQMGRRYTLNSSRTAPSPHSAIIYSISDSGVQFYEANTDGKNTIKVNSYSWSDLANKNKGFTIYEPNSYVLK